ncbi:ATP-binding cassette domain-containing protein [Candidatus Actinomarina sp.]|nr:ATP-binding cassette domain-containing protein [Candidatus Actinomarina sp.]
MKKIAKVKNEILYVSKLTKVNSKKLRIFLSAFLANATVLFDILIILIFSSFFTSPNSINNFFDFFINNPETLPILIFLRFFFVLLDKLNIRFLQLKISENLKSYLIKELYKKGNYSLGDATFYLTQFTDHISYFYGALAQTISGLMQILVYLIFLLITDLDTVLVFLLIGVVIYLPSLYFLKKGRIYMDSTYKYSKEINRKTQRLIDNMFLIKILKTENLEIENFQQNNLKYTISQVKNFFFNIVNSLTPNFIVTFSLSILIIFFGVLKNLTLEFIGITLRLVQTLGAINNGLNMAVNSYVHLERLREFSDNEVRTKVTTFEIEPKSKNIVELKNINFKYFGMDQLFFENLSLNIQRDKHTLITGPNGSGKSTLLGLISGVLTPLSGTMAFGTKKIGYVGVKPLIVEGTLKENLVYGNKADIPESDINDLIDEFDLFQEENFVSLNTTINNESLSSGQFQKIAFIRALLADVELLILDEATSNLDEASKDKIINFLNKKSLTIINSTHNKDSFKFDREVKILLNGDQREISP